jgi:ABC-2 type transport system ATP-binding protein
LEQVSRRLIGTLSKGYRQRVGIAQAILHNPPVVILDEPTNGLDPLERRAMLGRLVTLARHHGKTVLVSTHVLPDVQSICDRVVVLARGRVRLTGAIDDLTRPAIPAHRLEGDGPLDDLARLLCARGLPAWRAGGDEEALLLEPPGADRLGLVWESARDAGVVVRSLAPALRPLEDVFVQALRAADDADADGHEASGRRMSHATP